MNIRKIICFLLVIIIITEYGDFSGKNKYSEASSNDFTFSVDKHNVLGSPGYIDEIEKLAGAEGIQVALNRIMDDVDKYESELDNNAPKNNFSLYKLFSRLVLMNGSIDMKIHYFRNKLNRAPKTLKDMLALNKKLPAKRKWKLMPIRSSVYHIQGKNGLLNFKFLDPDGFCEAVYNKDGVLLTEKNDPENMGTFNFAPGMPGPSYHKKYDVDPFLKWGNAPNTPVKSLAQINSKIKLVLKDYSENCAVIDKTRLQILNKFK
ncbi:MAG: hypothetical protein Q8942_04550 [Bacillota bacterium]|nr:hypothetical protein [Bacillota bacterium]